MTFCCDSFFTGVMLVSVLLRTTFAQNSCKLNLSVICPFSDQFDSCCHVWPTGHSFFSHLFVTDNTPAVHLCTDTVKLLKRLVG